MVKENLFFNYNDVTGESFKVPVITNEELEQNPILKPILESLEARKEDFVRLRYWSDKLGKDVEGWDKIKKHIEDTTFREVIERLIEDNKQIFLILKERDVKAIKRTKEIIELNEKYYVLKKVYEKLEMEKEGIIKTKQEAPENIVIILNWLRAEMERTDKKLEKTAILHILKRYSAFDTKEFKSKAKRVVWGMKMSKSYIGCEPLFDKITQMIDKQG